MNLSCPPPNLRARFFSTIYSHLQQFSFLSFLTQSSLFFIHYAHILQLSAAWLDTNLEEILSLANGNFKEQIKVL